MAPHAGHLMCWHEELWGLVNIDKQFLWPQLRSCTGLAASQVAINMSGANPHKHSQQIKRQANEDQDKVHPQKSGHLCSIAIFPHRGEASMQWHHAVIGALHKMPKIGTLYWEKTRKWWLKNSLKRPVPIFINHPAHTHNVTCVFFNILICFYKLSVNLNLLISYYGINLESMSYNQTFVFALISLWSQLSLLGKLENLFQNRKYALWKSNNANLRSRS